MRIGILASPAYPIPPRRYGGTERVIYNLIRGLKELGHEPILFGAADSEVSCEVVPTTEHSIPFERQIVEEAVVASERKSVMSNALEILKENQHRLDVLHIHESVPYCDVTQLNIPMVSTVHGPFHFNNMDFFSERNSKMLWVNISESQRVPMPHLNYVGTIYNGLDVDDFQFNETPDDQICWIGRFSAEKAPHLALQLARKAKVPIVMGGKVDFVDREYFVNQCYPLIVDFSKHKISYLGELTLKETVDVFKQCYANIHLAPWREPFGLTVIEAALCGTPTLALKRGALKETIEDGVTGILVEDLEEGYSRLEELKSLDRNLISARAKERFSHRLMTKRYEKAYETAIEVFNEGLLKDKSALKKKLAKSQKEIAALKLEV